MDMGNISNTNIISGEYQEEGKIGYGTDIMGKVNEYDIVGQSGTHLIIMIFLMKTQIKN